MADVSIREAAAILGLSIDTIRRRVRTGELPASKGPRPSDPYTVHLTDDAGPESGTPTATSRELIDTLRHQIEFQEGQITDLYRLLDRALSLAPRPADSTSARPRRSTDGT